MNAPDRSVTFRVALSKTKPLQIRYFWVALRLKDLGCMRHEAGSLSISKNSHLSEGQKEQDPAMMFRKSESNVQSSDGGGFLLQRFTLSFPALSCIYTFPFPPKLVMSPALSCSSFTLQHLPPFLSHSGQDHLQCTHHASIISSFR